MSPAVDGSELETLPFSDSEVRRLRADFPAFANELAAVNAGDVRRPPGAPAQIATAYLDNAATAQRPEAVLAAMQACYCRGFANVHRGDHAWSRHTTDAYEAARDRVATFLNAGSSDQVIFTGGCTAAINLIAHSWGASALEPGDRVVATLMEHHANLVPWMQLAERRGIDLQLCRLTPDGHIDQQHLEELLTPPTKLLAVTAVSNVLGTINPVSSLVQKAHAAGVAVLVDAAQAVPHQRVDVQAWDCDFLVFSGHKCMGPTGIGVLYAKTELLESMPPFMGGGGMIDRVWESGFTVARIPNRFEAGTPPFVEAIGLAAALDYLQRLDPERVLAHEQRLVSHAIDGLRQIPGLQICGPADPKQRGGLISFVVAGLHANDIGQLCDAQGVAIRSGHHCAMPLHQSLKWAASARASFYLYNTQDEAERLIEAVGSAAERLTRPRRRRL
jgi:cysteine desulfurase / selenocysteine lyase